MRITIPNTGGGRKKPLIMANEFKKGTVSLLDDSRLTADMAKQSVNLIQTQDGLWSQRWGRAYYGTAITGEDSIDGADEYVRSSTEREIIAVGGTTGKIFKSVNGGAWTELTGATMTPGEKPYFKQIKSLLYITNGTDPLIRYNGTDLETYVGLDTPTGVTLTRNVLTAGSYNAFYQITALNEVGETVASTEVTTTVNKTRDVWASGEGITINWTAVTGAVRYQIYYSDESGYEEYLDSTTTNTYTDNATVQSNPYVIVPEDDTTTAPRFRQMALSNNRLWGTGDTESEYRVYFSGTGNFVGFFSEWYGGGWVDLEKGGRDMPIAIVHYRTGKGDSSCTVLCNSPDGEGTIWQISLENISVGDISFVVPIPQKIVGSTGTTSPYGVVIASDDIIFPNKQGIFSLSSRPQLMNVLSTAEKSQLIRPSYRGLNQAKIDDICGIFYDAKVFFSGAIGVDNDVTFILDLERKNWTWYWNFGTKQFLKATDNTGRTRLLYVPITGNQLVHINSNLATDFGLQIPMSYISGLLAFSEDDTVFAKVKEVIISLGRLKGSVTVKVMGIDARKGFSSLGTRQIEEKSLSDLTFVESIFGDYRFSYREGSPKTFAQANVKKRIRVNRKMNRIQVEVSSNTAGTEFTILSWQARGRISPTAIPSSWK